MGLKSDTPDSYMGCEYFGVELDGIVDAKFRNASGLSVHREVVEYVEGGQNASTHKLIGQTRWSNIVLVSGITLKDTAFWEWMMKTVKGEIERKSGSVILFHPDDTEAMRWNFYKAWPCRWEGPKLDSLTHEISISSIELAHDRLEFVKGSGE